MRTLLNEVADIEDYLFKKSETYERLLFEAKLIIHPQLKDRAATQKQVYELVTQYGRKQLKAELESIYLKMLNEPSHQSFRQKIKSIFGLT